MFEISKSHTSTKPQLATQCEGVRNTSPFPPPLALWGSLQSSMRLQADAVAAPFIPWWYYYLHMYLVLGGDGRVES